MPFKDSIRERTYEALTETIRRFLLSRLDGPATMLDIGCGDGAKTRIWADALGISRENLFGVEAAATYRSVAARHFEVRAADIETDPLPFEDGAFGLVVLNQVFEHVKNIFHLMSETCRITAVGGQLLLSVPNLASFHNRMLLLLGRQPTPIKVFCEHVRGYAPGALTELATASGDFEKVAETGGGFYPLPPALGMPLGRLWPGAAVYTIQLFRRSRASDPEYWKRWAGEIIDTRWASKS